MQNHGPKALRIAQKAMALHAFGVQVIGFHTSTPQLPFKIPHIPTHRDHKALVEVHWGVQVVEGALLTSGPKTRASGRNYERLGTNQAGCHKSQSFQKALIKEYGLKHIVILIMVLGYIP